MKPAIKARLMLLIIRSSSHPKKKKKKPGTSKRKPVRPLWKTTRRILKKKPAMERPNDPAMSHFWVCVQRNANRISKKDLHSPGHCSTVHNSRDTDTARAPVGRCTGKAARHTTHAENYCTPLLHARCRGLKCWFFFSKIKNWGRFAFNLFFFNVKILSLLFLYAILIQL